MKLKQRMIFSLQVTAFSQTALWIYLNIVPPNGFVNFMKWFVPSAAVLFYCMRSYAKLKDNNIWRYRSMYILALVFASSMNFLLNIVGAELKGILVIDGVDEMYWLFSSVIAIFPLAIVIMFKNEIKKRYGL